MGDLSVVGDRRARCANVAAQTRQREASALIWCCPAPTTVERSATLMQPALWQTARAECRASASKSAPALPFALSDPHQSPRTAALPYASRWLHC